MAQPTKDEYKEVAQYLASGVAMITSKLGSDINGMIATAICSVSVEPPLFLVCISKKWKSHVYIEREKVFSVNFLSEEQQEISELFGQPNPDKIDRLAAMSRPSDNNGCPIIEGCIAYLDCEVTAIYDAVDHSIFLGKVLGGEVERDAKPLIHFTGNYYTIS